MRIGIMSIHLVHDLSLAIDVIPRLLFTFFMTK